MVAETRAKRNPACVMVFCRERHTGREANNGGLPERIIGAVFKTADGTDTAARPFESDTRRQLYLVNQLGRHFQALF